MNKPFHARRLDVAAFAQAGASLSGRDPLQKYERLAQELRRPEADSTIEWQAQGEHRAAADGSVRPALHLRASVALPLTCQRCMGTVATPLEVDQWYRFVATEDIAMAQDDESEEDLLVMEPHFDLLTVLEDELLMALPLVPMHDECPVAPVLQVGEEALAAQATETGEKPNPFAVLAQLKK